MCTSLPTQLNQYWLALRRLQRQIIHYSKFWTRGNIKVKNLLIADDQRSSKPHLLLLGFYFFKEKMSVHTLGMNQISIAEEEMIANPPLLCIINAPVSIHELLICSILWFPFHIPLSTWRCTFRTKKRPLHSRQILYNWTDPKFTIPIRK